ncbi:MAG: NADH-quinone oxidoreductase subunit J [Saprospiraceae bacterium]|nr:NADH-quinone oxidoreductase subunit J [Saprospiraceae bacterium]
MIDILFFSLSTIAVVCSIMMVFHKNAVYSVLFLLAALFSIAGLYIMLNAQFLAIVHVIVYAGAIMVLFLYVIMFLNLTGPITIRKSQLVRFAAALTGLMMFLIIFASLWQTNFGESPKVVNQNIGYARTLGKVLFKEFLIPFEMTSILFLSAMIGVVIFNKKENTNA